MGAATVCASLAGLVLCCIACFILLVITTLQSQAGSECTLHCSCAELNADHLAEKPARGAPVYRRRSRRRGWSPWRLGITRHYSPTDRRKSEITLPSPNVIVLSSATPLSLSRAGANKSIISCLVVIQSVAYLEIRKGGVHFMCTFSKVFKL